MKEIRQLWDLESLVNLIESDATLSLFSTDDRDELYRLAAIYESYCVDMHVFANAVSYYFEYEAKRNADPEQPPSPYQIANEQWMLIRKEAEAMLFPSNLVHASTVIGCRQTIDEEIYSEIVRKVQKYCGSDSLQALSGGDDAEELAEHYKDIVNVIDELRKELLSTHQLSTVERVYYENRDYPTILTKTSKGNDRHNKAAPKAKPMVSKLDAKSKDKKSAQNSQSVLLPQNVVDDIKDLTRYLTRLHENISFLSKYCLFERNKDKVPDIEIGLKAFYGGQVDTLRQGCENAVNAYCDFVTLFDKICNENQFLHRQLGRNNTFNTMLPLWQLHRFAIARLLFLCLICMVSLVAQILFPAHLVIFDLFFYTAFFAFLEKITLFSRVCLVEFEAFLGKKKINRTNRSFYKQLLFCQSRALGVNTDLAYLFFPVYVFAVIQIVGLATPLSALLAASLMLRRLVPLAWVVFHCIQSRNAPCVESYDSIEKMLKELMPTKNVPVSHLADPDSMSDRFKQTISQLGKLNPLLALYDQKLNTNQANDLKTRTHESVAYVKPQSNEKRIQATASSSSKNKGKSSGASSAEAAQATACALQGHSLFTPNLSIKETKSLVHYDDISLSESFFRYALTMYPDDIVDALSADASS